VEAGDTPVLVHNCGNLVKDDGVSGGHALSDHVGKTDDELIARATREGGPASSLNPATAQASVDAVIERAGGAGKIGQWAARNAHGATRTISGVFNDSIGRVAGADGSIGDAYKLTLLIKRVDKGTDGHSGTWIVHTMMGS